MTPFQENKTARYAYIAAAYEANIPLKQIARTVGMTYGSVKVIASRNLKCTKQGRAIYDYRRGFVIPGHLQKEYNEMVYELRIPHRDAALMLGIVTAQVAAYSLDALASAPANGVAV